MTLPTTPPKYLGTLEEQYLAQLKSITRGERGWRVWALQQNLLKAGRTIVVDGDFGPATESVLKKWQENNGVQPLGFAGPNTQRVMLHQAIGDTHVPGLPDGVLMGFNVTEAGNLIAPVNWYTPVNQKPGVDLGPAQYRVYGPPFDQTQMKNAFDARVAYYRAGSDVVAKMREFDRRRPSLTSDMVLRLAILNHNAPFLAEQYVKNGRLTTPNSRPTSGAWAVNPMGGYFSHAEWLQVYPNRVLAYVEGGV